MIPCRFLGLALLLAAVLIQAPAHALERITLQLKWTHQFQFAGFYAAVEKGFYADEGLEVELRERDPAESQFEVVLRGEAQYGVSDASLILFRLQGSPLVILAAIYQHSPLVLITRAADDLLGPFELKGKRVMRLNGVDDAVITAMFHQLGIGSEDIIDVPHSFDNDSLIRGETDAMSGYVTNQPYYYRSLGVPIHIINPINYGVDFYGDILFTTEAEMRNHPDRAQRFRRASLKGWAYAMQNKEEVIDWLQKRYGVQRTTDRLRYEADAIETMILPELVEIGHLHVERLRRIADVYVNEGMAEDSANLDGIDYRDHLPSGPRLAKWHWWLLVTAISAFVTVLLLYALNRRLNRLVGQRTEELQVAKDDLQRYIDIVDRYVITSHTDLNGIITYASDAFCRISKYSSEELVGRPQDIVRHPDMPASVNAELWNTITQGKSWRGEIMNLAKDGTTYWVDVNIDPRLDHQGQIIGCTAVRQDITDKKIIEKLSITDRLTQLNNRHKLDDALEYEVARALRYQQPVSIILIDIDRFKEINDSHGHLAGDQALKEIAALIRLDIRASDVAGRWGGEEFMIICPSTETDGARLVAEKLRRSVELHAFDQIGATTCSFGVATLSASESAAGLLARADQALYRAKQLGRNRVEVAMRKRAHG